MTDADQPQRKSAFMQPDSKVCNEGGIRDARRPSIPSAAKAQPRKEAPRERRFTLLEEAERRTIIRVLKETGGNKLHSAKRLGIGRQTLYNKIKALDIAV